MKQLAEQNLIGSILSGARKVMDQEMATGIVSQRKKLTEVALKRYKEGSTA